MIRAAWCCLAIFLIICVVAVLGGIVICSLLPSESPEQGHSGVQEETQPSDQNESHQAGSGDVVRVESLIARQEDVGRSDFISTTEKPATQSSSGDETPQKDSSVSEDVIGGDPASTATSDCEVGSKDKNGSATQVAAAREDLQTEPVGDGQGSDIHPADSARMDEQRRAETAFEAALKRYNETVSPDSPPTDEGPTLIKKYICARAALRVSEVLASQPANSDSTSYLDETVPAHQIFWVPLFKLKPEGGRAPHDLKRKLLADLRTGFLNPHELLQTRHARDPFQLIALARDPLQYSSKYKKKAEAVFSRNRYIKFNAHHTHEERGIFPLGINLSRGVSVCRLRSLICSFLWPQ